jgi:hypothetical protein
LNSILNLFFAQTDSHAAAVVKKKQVFAAVPTSLSRYLREWLYIAVSYNIEK